MLGSGPPQHVPKYNKNAMPIRNAWRSTAASGEERGVPSIYGIMKMSSRTSFDPPRVFPELAQYLGIDIPTADHSDVDLRVGQSIGVKEKCSRSHGTARLGNGFRVPAQCAHGLANLVLGHGDDVVHIGADVFEIDRADALGAKAVRQCPRDLLGWR